MGIKVVDLSKRKPKQCPYCGRNDKLVEKMWDWLCKACMRDWPKLNKGQLYLKIWEDDK